MTPEPIAPEQIALVRESFTAIAAGREEVAALFYTRLFQIAPEVRALFHDDLRAQGAKLMAALAVVIRHLDRIELIIDDVRDLGRRHVGYGVREQHYGPVGVALIWSLEQVLGPAFTPATRAAWAAAYALLSGIMIEAARTASTR